MLKLDAYFPKIESVHDNYGNIYTPDSGLWGVDTGTILRIGDVLEFTITASDPRDEGLLFEAKFNHRIFEWQESNFFSYKIQSEDVRKGFVVDLRVKTHKIDDYDSIPFIYSVLPEE